MDFADEYLNTLYLNPPTTPSSAKKTIGDMDSSAERSTHKVLELDLIAPDQIDKAQNEIVKIFDGMGVCMTRAKLLLEQSGSNCSSL